MKLRSLCSLSQIEKKRYLQRKKCSTFTGSARLKKYWIEIFSTQRNVTLKSNTNVKVRYKTGKTISSNTFPHFSGRNSSYRKFPASDWIMYWVTQWECSGKLLIGRWMRGLRAGIGRGDCCERMRNRKGWQPIWESVFERKGLLQHWQPIMQ